MAYTKGGRADKSGNKYENNYLIYELLNVISEEITNVENEPTGDDEKGTDIIVTDKNGFREYQQCKGRNGNSDFWSISSLKSLKIFEKWKFQLDRDRNNKIGLVSPLSFVKLEDLTNMARTSSGDGESFYENQVKKSSKETIDFYEDYCKNMGLNLEEKINKQRALDYLQRTYYRQIPDQELKKISTNMINGLFYNDEQEVYDCLLDFIINGNILGRKIDANNLYEYLNGRGIKYSNLTLNKTIEPNVREINKSFEFKSIYNNMIPRDEEVEKCINAINENKSVIITGKAGYGKSGVIQLIIEKCKEENIPYIAVKLDKMTPLSNTKEWGKKFNLPASFTYCIDSISKDKKGLIILDQLDALRWTQANSAEALQSCKNIIDEVKNINCDRKNKISIIFACRSYDLKYDSNISSLFGDDKEQKWIEVPVDKLSSTTVKEIVGNQYENNSPKLNELLATPNNLFIWTKLDHNKSYNNCYTTNKLIEEWWNQILEKSDNNGIESDEAKKCIKEIVENMRQQSRMYILKESLTCKEKTINYLVSSEIIGRNESKIYFTHQRILDYFLQKQMLIVYNEGKTIEEIIGEKYEQTPARRYQIQMFLESLYDIDTKMFIEAGEKILKSNNIRFYTKHIFFEILGQADKIDEHIKEFILKNYNNKEYQKYIINEAVYGNYNYVRIFLQDKILDNWIRDTEKRQLAKVLLSSVRNKYDEEADKFFKRNLFKDDEIDKELYQCFNYDVSEESDSIFEMRMQLYEKYPELAENLFDFGKMFKKNEIRAIRLIAFWLKNKINSRNGRLYRFEEDFMCEDSEILINKGEEVVKMLLPFVPKECDELWGDWSMRYKYTLGIERTTINILKKANHNIISKKPEIFWDIYQQYMGKGYKIFNELILDGMKKLPEDYSDKILRYLFNDIQNNIFEETSGNGDQLLCAKEILKKHTKTCSQETYKLVENKICTYLSSDSKERYKYIRKFKLNYIHKKMYWDWFGNLQVELLPYLAQNRISKKANELYEVMKRKFYNNESTYYKYSDGHSGSVWSPIAGKNISDKQWIRILSNDKIIKNKTNNEKIVPGGFISSSFESFSSSFSEAVSKEPERMIKLVLKNKERVHQEYINSLYMGLAISKSNTIPIKLLEKLFKEFPCDNESTSAMYMCEIVDKNENCNWSIETLEKIKEIAEKHTDPILGKPNITTDNERKAKGVEMLISNALNCTRGEAAITISNLIIKRKELYEFFEQTIKKLTEDENPAVRFASIECLYATMDINSSWNEVKILEMINADIRFLGNSKTERIVMKMYNNTEYRKDVLRLIVKAYNNDDPILKRLGTFMIVKLNMEHNEFDIINKLKETDKTQREEIIRTIIEYFNQDEFNNKCKAIIIGMIKNNFNVEPFISQIFYDKIINLERDKEFLIETMKNTYGRRSIHALKEYLKNGNCSIVDLSEIILVCAKTFNEKEKDEMFDAEDICELTIGLYDATKGKDDNIANECLNAWDGFFRRQIGSAKKLSESISNL